ncbi:MAG: shikimate dehydrogenase family protein [Flavobacteriales bacterium]
MKKNYGLIGTNLKHSFSKDYFERKFKSLNYKNHYYKNFEINNLNSLRELISKNNLSGLNVTIPFKEQILKYVDDLDDSAEKIGSINTLKVNKNKITGFNTDADGFEKSFNPLIENRNGAIILGNGGASKAVQYVLTKNKIKFKVISRSGEIKYENLSNLDIVKNLIIINATPLGMYPDVQSFPKIPYNLLSEKHLVYDLVYNPKETVFLQKARKQKCKVTNGYQMLLNQADLSWKIWEN